ncbi:PRTRC system protein E [Paraburkholderia sediminicola]|jgi:PRTRC genetic system protein E|nr:PRTRC system protein E [Paraburkholderia sediminicola]
MFQQLDALVRASGKLQMVLKTDGDKLAVVMIPQGDSKEVALRQPLVLTGTPAELDEGFAAAIFAYSSVHASLSEQVAATTAILQEAEKSHASKAQKSLAKGGKATPRAATGADNEEKEDDDPASVSSEASTSSSPVPVAEEPAGTDLFSLIK